MYEVAGDSMMRQTSNMMSSAAHDEHYLDRQVVSSLVVGFYEFS